MNQSRFVDNLAKVKLPAVTLVLFAITFFLTGCVSRTGKIGKPIAVYYKTQLESLKLEESTPDDLKKAFFKKNEVSLKETRLDAGKKIEVWQVARGGDMDAVAFIMWGAVAYDKDQELLFHFEDGKLVSYESIVIPDPPSAAVSNAPPPVNLRERQ